MQREALVRTREQPEIWQIALKLNSHMLHSIMENWIVADSRAQGERGLDSSENSGKQYWQGISKKRDLYLYTHALFPSERQVSSMTSKDREQDCSLLKKGNTGAIGCRLCVLVWLPTSLSAPQFRRLTFLTITCFLDCVIHSLQACIPSLFRATSRERFQSSPNSSLWLYSSTPVVVYEPDSMWPSSLFTCYQIADKSDMC